VHQSALNQTLVSIREFVEPDRKLRVLDIAANRKPEEEQAHRRLLRGYDYEYRRLDVLNAHRGNNDRRPHYGIPLRSNQVDLVLCSQVLVHIPFFWVTLLEVARVLRPGGVAIVVGPSRGHPHGSLDCWRFYPDSFRAMAAYCGLTLKDSFTDLPRWAPERGQMAWETVPSSRYWGDSVGVLEKPERYPATRMAAVRAVALWWAHHVGGLDRVPLPPKLPGRAG
jgi:SAM-dependent methyltransferase